MLNALIRCKSLPHVKMEEAGGKNRKLKGSALPMQVSTSLLKSEKRANTEGEKKKRNTSAEVANCSGAPCGCNLALPPCQYKLCKKMRCTFQNKK
ncbi:hypothetical protein CDAR_252721 [Caerostris darwini]|uniref:Agouti signaling protein n=1 Tax=Caerostris darwini TaxID=1538125 RepID=A0AAV4Q481_9ARAC|nr:hypothetical protein CDAR_252721 [Caerostris darwini]